MQEEPKMLSTRLAEQHRDGDAINLEYGESELNAVAGHDDAWKLDGVEGTKERRAVASLRVLLRRIRKVIIREPHI